MFEEELNLREYLHILRKRRWIIMAITFVVVVSVTIATFRQTPVYQATARILIEKETPNVVSFKEILEMDTSAQDYYKTQYMILKSRSLGKKMLEKLGLLERALQTPPPPPSRFSVAVLLTKLQEYLGLQHPMQTDSDTDQAASREVQIIDEYLRMITVSPIRDSRLVDVSMTSTKRQITTLIANTLVEVYIEYNLENKLAASKEAVRWLTKELDTTQKKLVDSEAALQAYKEEHELISIEDRQNIVTQKLLELNSAVNEVKIKRSALEVEYRQLQQYNIAQLEAVSKVINNPLVSGLKSELSRLESERSELEKKFRDKHPTVEALDAQIASLRKRLDAEIKRVLGGIANEYDVAVAQEKDLMKMLEQQKQESLELDQKSIKYKQLQREVESNQRIYDTLLQRAKEASITERLEISNISIVDRATVPTIPIAPRKTRNVALGIVMGLLIGISLAFAFEYLDSSIKTSEDLKRYLDLPFLGLVPKVSLKEKPSKQTRHAADTVVAFSPKSNAAEAYRSLRTNITFALLNDEFGGVEQGAILLVTSANPAEGKSCVAANLAIAMAQSGSKTLVIDCDFRRPVMHKIFNIKESEYGFADMITNVKNSNLKKGVQPTNVPNLFVIPCGKIPNNPSELLSSSLTRMLLQALAEQYDKIVLDSPPINTVTDPVILSRLADGVVFILRASETRREAAQRAAEQLRAADAPMLGAVLNSVDLEKDKYYYYSYYRYYNKYYSYSDDNGHPRSSRKSPIVATKDNDDSQTNATIVLQGGKQSASQ